MTERERAEAEVAEKERALTDAFEAPGGSWYDVPPSMVREGFADVAESGVNALKDLLIGATSGADPSTRTEPVWDQPMDWQELGEVGSLAMAPLAVGGKTLKRLLRTPNRRQPTRIQWMANREGGQRIGNQEEIHPLSEELFDKYVRQLLNEDWAFRPFEEYQKYHPDTHIKLIRNLVGPAPTPSWQVMKLGSYDELLPHGKSQQWAKEVESFDDQVAIDWSKTADSDVEFGR